MSQLYSNCPPYWNSNDHQNSGSLSKGLSLKVDSPPQLHLKARSLCFSLQDHDSSSSQSTYSNHDLAATAGTNSQEQCLSSESGQEVSCAKNGGQTKPVYLMDLTDGSFNTGQIDYNREMTYMPYSCVDPNFTGLMTAYGPPPVIHTHMMGVTNPRVPLPLDISDDEPIYVNAKQYNGILRRRQLRAKMEAQNKLIKVRKPYLHESRHLHALNRVRGTGGRFLSSKKSQQPDSNSTTPNHIELRSTGFDHNGNTLIFEHHQSSRDPEAGNSNGVRFFQHPDHGFSGMQSSHGAGSMQRNARFMNNSNQHYASVVQ